MQYSQRIDKLLIQKLYDSLDVVSDAAIILSVKNFAKI